MPLRAWPNAMQTKNRLPDFSPCAGFFFLFFFLPLLLLLMVFYNAYSLLRQQLSGQRWVSGRECYTNCSYWVHLTKASRWAGNVGELPKHPGPISSLLFNGFTPIPYDGVYCFTCTPLPPPLSFKHTSCTRSKESESEREPVRENAMRKDKQEHQKATLMTLRRAPTTITHAQGRNPERVNKRERKALMN